MPRISPLDFSQARMASDDVVRGLEALDPTACVVHLGEATWLVGKIRPNTEARGEAEAMLDNWTRAVRGGRRLSAQGQLRVRLAQLALHGFRVVAQYRLIGEPDARIVKDFAESRFRWLHTSDNAVFHALDTEQRDRAEAAQKEVGSIDRAKDAWHYAFTRTHTTSASLTPPDKPRSGFVRHAIPSSSENSHAS